MRTRILQPMQNAEIELKFPVRNLPALLRSLDVAGFLLDTPRTFERNTLYDTPARDLRSSGQLLRVRHYGPLATVTHKRHPDQEDTHSPYKVRIETESAVADGPALAEIFIRIGYGPVFHYEKFRTEYSHPDEPGAHLVVDETPIGTYVELEGPTRWIDRTLRELGVSPGDCITESYGKLFLAWKEQTRSPADNLTFREVEGREFEVQGMESRQLESHEAELPVPR